MGSLLPQVRSPIFLFPFGAPKFVPYSQVSARSFVLQVIPALTSPFLNCAAWRYLYSSCCHAQLHRLLRRVGETSCWMPNHKISCELTGGQPVFWNLKTDSDRWL